MLKKTNNPKSSRYYKIVEWNDDDKCFVGTCPGLMLGGVHGDDETAVYAELCQAVEEVVELLEKEGHPLPQSTADKTKYSGKFVLRLDPSLHHRLAVKAMACGESLNTYCTKTLLKA